MPRKSLPVDMYQYYDYRLFLRELCEHWKRGKYRASYRKLAASAGFATPNALQLVIDGTRNLGDVSIGRICDVFAFNKGEREFFTNLVHMNQSQTSAEKDLYYQRMGKARKYMLAHREDKNLYQFYSHWYYPVVRELVSTNDFSEDPEWIAARINPPITPEQARVALRVLEKTGQIARVDGRWKQSSPLMTTGAQVQSLAVARYHAAMIGLARHALERHPHDKRDISSLTLAVSPQTYQTIVKEVYALQQRIIDLAVNEQQATEVYQVNFQVFPVTRTRGESP